MDNKTVLISGAGIGGPTLAFWLGAAGFETTLIERAPALRMGGYVIDFWGLGYDIAERMGLAGEIERIGYHMREMRIVDEGGNRVTGFGTRVLRELAGGRFVTLGRSDLSRLLFERIDGSAEVMFGDEIVGLDERSNGVHVQFERGSDRRFDLVIGADGLHSNVRRLVFGPQDRFERQLGYVAAAFEVRGYRPRDEDVYVIYGEPGRMLARFALHDDRTLFLFVFAAEARLPEMRDLPAQKAMLHERFGGGRWECPCILDALDRTPDLYFDRVSQIRMQSWSKGRVALVGDAAFCVSLTAGQGSALAMTAAYVLAGELANASGRHDDAFRKYEELLRAFISSKQQGAARFAAAFAPKTRLGLFLRNQVIRAFVIPGLARLAFGRDIVDTLRLPDYRWPALVSTGVEPRKSSSD
jgi:2-polyprenyl-6-methoxyphenol hydroxylase-like FAD-dependent oxidoreductase